MKPLPGAISALALGMGVQLSACGNSDDGVGGASNAAGSLGAGGATSGGISGSNGGVGHDGGSVSSGGAVNSGGAVTASGMTGSGGVAQGGATTQGGAVGAGGARTTGGSVANGGSSNGGSPNGGSSGSSAAAGQGGSATAKGGAAGSATGGAPAGGSTSCANFSFFVTSAAAMKRTSGSPDGFGGDLRHGEADGLAGADKICQEIATKALPCAGSKTWRAFLCTSGVDAITRIGPGPWYDRMGQKVWNSISEMSADRPPASYPYRDDLPNEDGNPNGDANLDGNQDQNHMVLTACGKDGKKIATDAPAQRCNDWTSTSATGTGGSPATIGGLAGPMTGHSWPRGNAANWIDCNQRQKGCGACDNQATAVGTGTCGMVAGYGGIYCFATTP